MAQFAQLESVNVDRHNSRVMRLCPKKATVRVSQQGGTATATTTVETVAMRRDAVSSEF